MTWGKMYQQGLPWFKWRLDKKRESSRKEFFKWITYLRDSYVHLRTRYIKMCGDKDHGFGGHWHVPWWITPEEFEKALDSLKHDEWMFVGNDYHYERDYNGQGHGVA